jgi:ABC-type polysaccharide/polyol phosphate transport system ATPase subunit
VADALLVEEGQVTHGLHDKPILSAIKINKAYEGRIAVRDVSFEGYRNEMVCILGHNGTGKTTLCNIISGKVLYVFICAYLYLEF